MDIRDTIIRAVTAALQAQGQQESVIAAVQDALVIQLNEYEIQERCTAVTTVDTSAEALLKRYLATKRIEGLADSTLRRYAEINLEVIRFLSKPLYEVSTYDLRFYLSVRRQQGRVSNRTLDGMRRCINGFFGWMSAEGLIGRNPCAALKQIKYRKVVKKPYSAVELEKMRNACENIRDLALIEFLYATACRVSEVSRLDIVDVDFENLECTVLGKGNKERVVYLTEVAAMYLKQYLDTRKDTSNALFNSNRSI